MQTCEPARRDGKIFAEYWICCGSCGSEFALSTTSKKVAEVQARTQGYERIPGTGWVCEGCRE